LLLFINRFIVIFLSASLLDDLLLLFLVSEFYPKIIFSFDEVQSQIFLLSQLIISISISYSNYDENLLIYDQPF
jgi:hypothetical protein